MKKPIIIGIVVLAAVVGLSFWSNAMTSNEAASLTTREAAFTCVSHGGISYHVHPMIRIVIDGEEQPVPADIGITPSCMKALHTHDATGKIHVEYPHERDFTLGDFFAVWDKPFSSTQVLDYVATGTARIRVTVNGADVDTYENTVLHDHDEIVIFYEPKP